VEVILKAIEKAGYKAGEEVFIALDPAMTELYDASDRSVHAGDGRQEADQR
jgi:enolase